MATVFVSHRTSDAAQAERLAKDIRDRGHNVWLDIWEVKLGDSIVEKMNEGLERSTFLILGLSSKGVLSPWMSREWYSALARQMNDEKVKLLPVILSGGGPPAILADIEYTDAVKDYDKALADLLESIEGP
jgi:hypothetical protein